MQGGSREGTLFSRRDSGNARSCNVNAWEEIHQVPTQCDIPVFPRNCLVLSATQGSGAVDEFRAYFFPHDKGGRIC